MDDLDLATIIFLEDEESSEDENFRSKESEMFKSRYEEGAFFNLVRRHLYSNDEKFRQYFRFTPLLFDYVLNHIRGELITKAYNRNKNPISPEHKLCIFIR